tara:strand:+ start:2416 stop:2589 length:174 start_codon:yes stop_codon:yes gene_type:complete
MKLPTEKINTAFNTMTLTGISLMWGQMLGLLNPYFTVLTVLCILVGYGSEMVARKES